MSIQKNDHYLSPTSFLLLTLTTLWAGHAIAFFAHEYGHSFTAWLLGWKRNPLGLQYAHPSWTVLLMQLGISQNVDEAAIFARGHGVQAGIISAAGAVLGNGLISLPLSRWMYSMAQRRVSPAWAMLAYWTTVASVGNFIDYVPIRTFVTGTDLDQDMYAVEKGFGISPYIVLIVLGTPTVLALVFFFKKIQPEAMGWLFPYSTGQRVFTSVLTALILFGFYGDAGWKGCGPVAHWMSVVCVCLVAPLAAGLTGYLAVGWTKRSPHKGGLR